MSTLPFDGYLAVPIARQMIATREPFQIPEDGFFAMGDNSPASLDSRAWGAVHEDNLLGRGFGIFWPALPWRFDLGFIH